MSQKFSDASDFFCVLRAYRFFPPVVVAAFDVDACLVWSLLGVLFAVLKLEYFDRHFFSDKMVVCWSTYFDGLCFAGRCAC